MTVADAQDWLSIAVAVLAVLGVGWRVIRGIDRRIDQLNEVDGHAEKILALSDGLKRALSVQQELHGKVDAIAEAIRPTNGDQRSMSDRLDTVKRDVQAMQAELVDVHGDIDQHTIVDQRNFGAIAEWSNQFKEFDPMKLPE